MISDATAKILIEDTSTTNGSRELVAHIYTEQLNEEIKQIKQEEDDAVSALAERLSTVEYR